MLLKVRVLVAAAAAASLAAPGMAAEPAPVAAVSPLLDPDAALAGADRALARAASGVARFAALLERASALIQLDRTQEAEAAIAQARAIDPARRGEVLLVEAHLRSQLQDYPGTETALREALAIAVAAGGAQSAGAAAIESFLGSALTSQGKYEPAIAAGRHSWDAMQRLRPPGDEERVNAGIQLGFSLGAARLTREAEAQFRAMAEEAQLLPERHNLRIKSVRLLGSELLRQGRMNEALPFLRQAVDLGETGNSIPKGERADTITALGFVLLYLDRPEDALPFFERGVELFGQSGARSSLAGALLSAGTAADRSGDRQRGLAYRDQAAAVIAALPRRPELVVALNEFKRAQSYANVGRIAEAEGLAAHAAEVLGRLRPPSHFQVTNSAISLGWIRVLGGRPVEGLTQVKQAFETSLAVNEQLEAAKNQVVGVLDNVEAYSQALDAAVRAGDPAFTFQVLQVMVESDASRAAVAVATREGAADSALGKLLRQRQEAAGALVEAEAALTRAIALSAGGDQQALRAAREARSAALASIDAALDRAHPGFRTLLRPRRIALAEAQARLAPGETLLIAVEGDLGLITMAVTRKAVAVGRSPLRRHEVRALVRRIRAGIDAGRAEDFDVAAAHALYRALFTPEVAALVRPGMRLRLAAGDILSALPLSLLVTDPGKRADTPRFLLEDHALSIVPALAAMGSGRDDRRGGGRLVAVGAPLQASPALAALPGAAREMEQVARLLRPYGAPVVLAGAAATEPALRALDLRNLGVLLFATHGLVAGAFDAASEPALVMTPGFGSDGLLTASEAAQLDTDAQWVILSACDTAGGGHPSAAGYTGLARAFLFAGARRVVASHWPVRDDISARISLGIVKAMRGSKRPDEALRAAILAVMHDRKLADSRNPALWAPFMVVSR